jgi:hypothetical protein
LARVWNDKCVRPRSLEEILVLLVTIERVRVRIWLQKTLRSIPKPYSLRIRLKVFKSSKAVSFQRFGAMKLLFISSVAVQLIAGLPNGVLESRQSMGEMPGMTTTSSPSKDPLFPWPIDKDLVEGPNVVKIRYGPHKIKANSEVELFLTRMKKPCDDCWITAFQGGLEYTDGTVANADTGAWLHHMQMDRVGSKKTDPTCGGTPLMEGMGERIYSVGNEREVSRTNNKAKYGVSELIITS